MGIGFRELLIILLIALVLFGAKKLRNVGSDLGAAVRNFKKSVNEGDEEQTKQLSNDSGKDAGFTTHRRRQARQQAEHLIPMFEVGFSEILLIFGSRCWCSVPSDCRSSPRTSDAGPDGRGRWRGSCARSSTGSPVRPAEGSTGTDPTIHTPRRPRHAADAATASPAQRSAAATAARRPAGAR